MAQERHAWHMDPTGNQRHNEKSLLHRIRKLSNIPQPPNPHRRNYPRKLRMNRQPLSQLLLAH